jgi:hypothetical protein
LRRAVPRAEVLLFTRRKASALKQVDLRDPLFLYYRYSVQLVGNNSQGKSENVFSFVCMPTVVVSPDHLPPIPPTSSGVNTPRDRQGP